MMQLRQFGAVAMLALLLGAGMAPVMAQSDDGGRIVEQQQTLREDIQKQAGAFKDLDKADRDELLNRQARVLELLAGRQSLAELETADRGFVASELAWIDGAVRRAEDDRIVCRMEKKIGSNRSERICTTAAQQRRQREQAREQLSRTQQRGN